MRATKAGAPVAIFQIYVTRKLSYCDGKTGGGRGDGETEDRGGRGGGGDGDAGGEDSGEQGGSLASSAVSNVFADFGHLDRDAEHLWGDFPHGG